MRSVRVIVERWRFVEDAIVNAAAVDYSVLGWRDLVRSQTLPVPAFKTPSTAVLLMGDRSSLQEGGRALSSPARDGAHRELISPQRPPPPPPSLPAASCRFTKTGAKCCRSSQVIL
ncbi:hypothetical protein AAFF_G00211810 [Aldrovandia affinis]|uniref:Uncharacterized protein n=1 Tax=Aldrovandia affinis TaxID=143900 RepID=A0AAD7RH22_9TELE|nr:hypothetical protein AAFF_G00211810 [Aldrovandia affinis]